jgi:hypothetical protein
MSSSAMSGDFWCKEHSTWNCMCYLPPGSITTSGGSMARKRDEVVTYFQSENVLQLGEGNYVMREDNVVTIRSEDGKAIVSMEYGTWRKLGGKEL